MDLDKPFDKKNTDAISRTDLYIMTHSKYFMGQHMAFLSDKLSQLDESRWNMVLAADLKDPGIIQLASFSMGAIGIDRFLIGDTGVGVGKLLTCGGFGIWTIVDWFSIQDATKQANMEKLQQFL